MKFKLAIFATKWWFGVSAAIQRFYFNQNAIRRDYIDYVQLAFSAFSAVLHANSFWIKIAFKVFTGTIESLKETISCGYWFWRIFIKHFEVYGSINWWCNVIEYITLKMKSAELENEFKGFINNLNTRNLMKT